MAIGNVHPSRRPVVGAGRTFDTKNLQRSSAMKTRRVGGRAVRPAGRLRHYPRIALALAGPNRLDPRPNIFAPTFSNPGFFP